ncbi:MAG: glycosyltransferase family 2 protein [Clostridiaceae bacterium]|nr:glycosyltransferase family 2 protein [Clostridiaceae bacterium]
MEKLSIIVPVYYNQDNLLPLYADMKTKVLDKLDCDYELIFVDDGSGDRSYEVMEQLALIDPHVLTLKLSRNFGEHAAILAGLSRCTGTCAIRKAADLQDPSELVLEMLAQYHAGYKVVLAVREGRDEPWHQRAASSIYTLMMRKLALPNMPKGGFDCFLIDKQVIRILTHMNEKNTSLMAQILWSGFKTCTVPYQRQKRRIGKSRWTLSKKVKLFIDSLLGFSYFPIRFITGIGICSFLGSLIWMVVALAAKITARVTVEGYTTLLMLLLMSFGVIMLSLGILGEYLWRMFDATRNRPPFILDEPGDSGLKKEAK